MEGGGRHLLTPMTLITENPQNGARPTLWSERNLRVAAIPMHQYYGQLRRKFCQRPVFLSLDAGSALVRSGTAISEVILWVSA